MGFTVKDWKDATTHEGGGDTSTPISSAALEDQEQRTTDYIATYAGFVNVWESEDDPESVTDWGPVINALLTAGHHNLFFGAHDFPFSTTITPPTPATDPGYVFAGVAGAHFGTGTIEYYMPTNLIWEATGSGVAIDLDSVKAFEFRDICVKYTSLTYTGHLIDWTGGSGSMHRTIIYGNSTTGADNAASLIRLGGAGNAGLLFHVSKCALGGAETCIRGPAAGYFNTATFSGCSFHASGTAHILNPCANWTFDNCVWEFPDSGATAAGIASEAGHGGTWGQWLTVSNCAFWDMETTTQLIMYQPVGVEWNLRMTNSIGYDTAGHTVPQVQLLGKGNITIEDFSGGGNPAVIDLGDVEANGTNSRKNYVCLRNIKGGPSGGSNVVNIAGHNHVEHQGAGNPVANLVQARGNQVTTIGGYERIVGTSPSHEQATATVHSGYSAPTGFISSGTSLSMLTGILLLDTANGQAPSGDAVDITFGTSLRPAWRTGGPDITLAVHLQPCSVGESYPDGAAMIAAQPYPVVPIWSTWADTVAITGFTIAFTNVIAQGTQAGIAWRVMVI